MLRVEFWNGATIQATDLDRCSRAAQEYRDARGLASSQWGAVRVFDQGGELLASISHNGRVWAPGPWYRGKVPILEASR